MCDLTGIQFETIIFRSGVLNFFLSNPAFISKMLHNTEHDKICYFNTVWYYFNTSVINLTLV